MKQIIIKSATAGRLSHQLGENRPYSSGMCNFGAIMMDFMVERGDMGKFVLQRNNIIINNNC